MKLLLSLLTLSLFTSCKAEDEIVKSFYLASATTTITTYTIEDDIFTPADTLIRGNKIDVITNKSEIQKLDNVAYLPIKTKGKKEYVATTALVDSLQGCVLEGERFVRTPASIIDNTATSHIATLADKGSKVEIIGFDSLYADGSVRRYKVRQGGAEGFIYAKYLVDNKIDAQQRYKASVYDAIHGAVKDSFNGGAAIGCDFYPTTKPKFENNPMPKACYSLYLNISPAVLGNIDAYIALAKQTKINTFVIDIKDNECPGYKAEAMKIYSPTNYRHAGDKEKLYKKVVAKLHEQGFYVVGRITCFKDSYFVADHPEVAITEKATGQPFKHNKAYWPSAYDRKVWQFNVELAKEAVRKFGFNEINFDYVRFPDRMTRVEGIIDYHNKYNESKVQAIQRFVTYACDEIHAEGAYVSIDVFGESANPGYTTAYGQYWPALSNVADVMCGMPYPDHFSNFYYGIEKPWNHPYQILNAWGKRVQDRQAVTPTPAIVRTWVQAYNVMRHVDRNGIAYNAENVEKEIRGLYDAGLTGGYTTWLSSSNIEKYTTQKEAFKIDYLKEHQDKN